MSDAQLYNTLGALALALTDLVKAGVAQAGVADLQAEAVALIGRSPGRSIRALSTDVQLSHAATLRMVGRLTDAALVRREPSPSDGRAVRLWLTPSGKRVYRRLLAARREQLSGVLETLSPSERQALTRIADNLLVAIVDGGAATSRLCRLCDVRSCERCPINASREARELNPSEATTRSTVRREREPECPRRGRSEHGS